LLVDMINGRSKGWGRGVSVPLAMNVDCRLTEEPVEIG
jgi:hypothetical protein